MYGTIGHLHIKTGMEEQFRQLIEEQARAFETGQVPGFVASYAYHINAAPNEYYIAAVFESRES